MIDYLKLRYTKFVREYIANGFNASDAYGKVYRCKDRDIAKVGGNRLLTNIYCVEILCDELAKTDIVNKLNAEFIYVEALKLFRSAKSEQTKARIIELLSKIKGLTKEQLTQNVAIFSDIEQALKQRKHTQPVEIDRDTDRDTLNK